MRPHPGSRSPTAHVKNSCAAVRICFEPRIRTPLGVGLYREIPESSFGTSPAMNQKDGPNIGGKNARRSQQQRGPYIERVGLRERRIYETLENECHCMCAVDRRRTVVRTVAGD